MGWSVGGGINGVCLGERGEGWRACAEREREPRGLEQEQGSRFQE